METQAKAFQAKQPDYKGELPVAIWKNIDKNGKTYLSCSIGGVLKFNLFKNEDAGKPAKSKAEKNEEAIKAAGFKSGKELLEEENI